MGGICECQCADEETHCETYSGKKRDPVELPPAAALGTLGPAEANWQPGEGEHAELFADQQAEGNTKGKGFE